MATWTHAGQYGPNDLRKWNSVSQQLTYPASVTVYVKGTTVLASLYTDTVRTSSSSNPVPLNVTPNLPGVDTNGNLLFFAEPGGYDLLIDGTTYTVHIPPLQSDVDARLSSLSLGSAGYVNF